MGELNSGEVLVGQTVREEDFNDFIRNENDLAHPGTQLEAFLLGDTLELELPQQTAAELLQDAREKVDATFETSGLVKRTTENESAKAHDVIEPQESTPVQKKPTKKEAIKQDLALHLRGARAEDIDQLVAVDLKTFDSVYSDWKIENGGEMTDEELKTYLTGMFTERVEMLGGQWIRVLEKGGKIVGCIVACPTSKPPTEFKSWEDTTDNGSLETTYDPNGKFLYVVSLSAMPEVSTQNGKDMLMANMIGRIIGGNYHAYFESRLPGLKRWILTQCRQTKTSFGKLSQEEMDGYASRYLRATTEIHGKKVPIDPLLRDYASVGCSFLKVVPDAYKDKRSLSYGAVCEFDHRLANIVRRIPVVRKAAGGALGLASHSSFITQKVL